MTHPQNYYMLFYYLFLQYLDVFQIRIKQIRILIIIHYIYPPPLLLFPVSAKYYKTHSNKRSISSFFHNHFWHFEQSFCIFITRIRIFLKINSICNPHLLFLSLLSMKRTTINTFTNRFYSSFGTIYRICHKFLFSISMS